MADPDGAQNRISSTWAPARDPLLWLGMVAFAVVLFGVTSVAVRAHRSEQFALGQHWFSEGNRQLAAGNAAEATAAFRNALAYDPDNDTYRVRLAAALSAGNNIQQARAQLLAVLGRNPADAQTSFDLARLAVRLGNVPEAVRYYHAAIYGVWTGNPIADRLQARFELAEFLLQNKEEAQAKPELLAIAADLPPDPAQQLRLADMMERAGAPREALRLYLAAFNADRRRHDALAKAGVVAFDLGDYDAAQGYLTEAHQAKAGDERTAQRLRLSKLVISIDPLRARLPHRERVQRAERAFHQAMQRLRQCASSTGQDLNNPALQRPLRDLYVRAGQMASQVRRGALARDPDFLQTSLELVFEIEKTTAQACGAPEGLDLALLLLADKQAE
jgi:tetratricopeptide (TPR) repeat protein